MFDKTIVRTDSFVEMPQSSQNLYFHLGMEADDEGFVSPKMIMRSINCGEDDLKVLVAKKFVILFSSGVIVITSWNQNNYLDKNRMQLTKFITERDSLKLTDDGVYVLNACLTSIEEKRVEENKIIEKRNDKSSYGELGRVKLTDDEYRKLIEKFGEKNTNILIFELDTYVASKNKRYASHYATLLNWAKRKFEEQGQKSAKYTPEMI